MSFDAERLYQLLPALYRLRDANQGRALEALMEAIAREVGIIEEDLAQLYDDQFIETCADWVVPYIGDLIGYRPLHGIVPKVSSPRAEVANTIGYRRRKGTASVLEELAETVTGWDARVVEFFQQLATTQSMNHLRSTNLYAPDLRQWEPLEQLGTPFNTIAHTADVRRIPPRRGRYNIPNIGIFLWRLFSYPLTNLPAVKVDDRRYLFSPLGSNTPLFTYPQREAEFTHLAKPLNVPDPIRRRVLSHYLNEYYGRDKSLFVTWDGTSVPVTDIVACNLSDDGSSWANLPQTKVAIDPVLGRLAFPASQPSPKTVLVSFHYGFSANMGGGEYDRTPTINSNLQPIRKVPLAHSTIQDALTGLSEGAIEINNSNRYPETPILAVAPQQTLELRAGDRHRPTLVIDREMSITGSDGATVSLNGLLIVGGSLTVTQNSADPIHWTLHLRHCTLLPGHTLDIKGQPQQPTAPSLVINPQNAIIYLNIEHCILGSLQVANSHTVRITHSILDATAVTNTAYTAPNGSAGGALQIENSTVIGKVNALTLEASNTIFLSPVRAERRQQGCVRFSYIPATSVVPRQYQCQPERAITQRAQELKLSDPAMLPAIEQNLIRTRLLPQFTSLRYGNPGYGQLSLRCAPEIRQGTDDGSEMGAFHDLYQFQREKNLQTRLDEYLRFGFEAGIFYVT
ncbi:MAG: hypothetical protein SFY66_10240 [Oculatellaceae cyanobacterium bins.114]|nr:hypothetical protein [Oculatellaceae cyanobacterium bins.114]